MNYKKIKNIFYILSALLFLALITGCLPKTTVNESKTIVSVKLEDDIAVYKEGEINLKSPKIYTTNGNYYFGNFFYIADNTLYMIDVSNKSIIKLNKNGEKHIISLPYENIDMSHINLVDSDENVYMTIDSSIIKEIVTERTRYVTVQSESPDIDEGEEEDTKVQRVAIKETVTNYTKTGVVSLSKISTKTNNYLDIDSVLKPDFTAPFFKTVSLKNGEFSILKYENNEPYLEIIEESGNIKERLSLKDIEENYDEKNISYKQIVDIIYMPEKDIILILTSKVEKGQHTENNIYTINLKNIPLQLKKEYTLQSEANTIPIAITEYGSVISSGNENGRNFITKVNPFTSQKTIKEYLDTSSIKDIRSIVIFGGKIYAYSIKDNIITFYSY